MLLSEADDVPEDMYSIIRPVVDKLRLHVTSNYANVGSNYEADLLPMYTELTKACEALLAKANSLNRATTPTSTLTNTGTTSVLALHALTTAGGRRGGTNGSPSTGGMLHSSRMGDRTRNTSHSISVCLLQFIMTTIWWPPLLF